MRYILIITLIASVLFTNSCKHEDNMLEKDKAMLKEKLSSSKVMSYKAIKVLLRSANYSEEQKEEYKEINKLANFVYDKIIAGDKVSLTNYYHIVKDFHKVKDDLLEINEDELPTILDMIIDASNDIAGKSGKLEHIDSWSASYEHLVLSVTMQNITSFTNDFSLYEVSLIDNDNMADNELKALANIYQAMIYTENELNYLAEDVLTKNIAMIESGKIKSTEKLDNTMFGNKDQINELAGISYLMRGLARNNMNGKDNKEKALDDFTKFHKISEKAGVNNELSNLAGIYIYYKKGDIKQTKAFFKKLKKSKHFDKEQRNHIDELIDIVDGGGKLNFKEDLLSVLEVKDIFGNKIGSVISENSYFEKVRKSKAGKTLFELPDKVYGTYSDFKDVKDKGKEYLKKIKGLFD